MNKLHFDDTVIQNFAENINFYSNKDYNHFEECPECKSKLILYQYLFNNINKLENNIIPLEFSSSLIKELTLKKEKKLTIKSHKFVLGLLVTLAFPLFFLVRAIFKFDFSLSPYYILSLYIFLISINDLYSKYEKNINNISYNFF